MAITYELWDGESGNAIGDYDTAAEALAVVAEAIRRNGRESVATYGLLRVDARGRGKLIAEGEALADRALAAAQSQEPAPERAPIPV